MQATDPILSLRVVRLNDEPVAEPIATEFDCEGGTIGRAIDCTLVLPDQQRAISRVHARIEFRDGAYLLSDLGSNPSVLNRRAIGGTREARLTNGDRLNIGQYLLEVSIVQRVQGARGAEGFQDPLAAAKILGDSLTSIAQQDPIGLDPLGRTSPGARAGGARYEGSASDHVSPEQEAFSAPVPAAPHLTTPSVGGIPAGYDPLADAIAQWEARPESAAAPQRNAPAPEARAGAGMPPHAPVPQAAPHDGPTGLPPSLLDEAAGAGVATPFDSFLAPAAPARHDVPARPAASAARSFMPIAPPDRDSDRRMGAARTPAPPAPPDVPTRSNPELRPAQPSGAAPLATGDPYTALLEGLGFDPAHPPGLPAPKLAKLAGAMLREALAGTMGVLRARSMTKREARLDVTMIVARDNNPLKFFPNVDGALTQMLSGRGGGYLSPDEAIGQAFGDIQAHEMAVLAGMRAAFAHMLGRFDPAEIEARLPEGRVIDKVLSNRKAKLWDLFIETQAETLREADEDFQSLFGRAFNTAYEAQIEALRTARANGKAGPANHE